jgi:hypothetical protein
VLAGAVLWAVGGLGAKELPGPLAEALLGDGPGYVARVEWRAVRTHPVFETAVELDTQPWRAAPGPAAMVLREVLGAVDELHVEAAGIEQMWWYRGEAGTGLWLRSSLTGEALSVALGDGGWELESRDDDAEVFIEQPDAEAIEQHHSLLDSAADEHERAELEAMLNRMRRRLTRCHERWIVVARYGHRSRGRGGCGGPLVELDDGPVFPRDVLVSSSRRDLIRVAIDLPGNDGGSDPDELSERERLRAQIEALGSGDEVLFSQLTDFTAVLSEADGGLMLDIVGWREDGAGVGVSARFLRMAVLGARFAVAPTAPALDRELGDAVIVVEGDRVRANLAVSQATLVETLEHDAWRRAELDRLHEEIRRLDGAE